METKHWIVDVVERVKADNNLDLALLAGYIKTHAVLSSLLFESDAYTLVSNQKKQIIDAMSGAELVAAIALKEMLTGQ
jgi:hypothetical protein